MSGLGGVVRTKNCDIVIWGGKRLVKELAVGHLKTIRIFFEILS